MLQRATAPNAIILGGIVVFAIAMGVGRFAYTPMLPPMHMNAGLSYATAGTLAAINSCGYLIGALLSVMGWARRRRYVILLLSLLAIIFATALMAVSSVTAWEASRLIAGIASGFAFVLISSFLLERSASDPRLGWLPYCGVGLGIAATGVLVPLFIGLGAWQFGWVGLALTSCAFVAPMARLFKEDDERSCVPSRSAPQHASHARAFSWLLLAYGCEGLGYIVPATFMVAIVRNDAAVSHFANLAWVIVGLVATPSLFLWIKIRDRLGGPVALALAFCVQAGGVFISAAVHNTFAVVCAAATLGGTFLGISAVSLSLGRRLSPLKSQATIGLLTTVFGVGQIVGPLAASGLLSRSGDYTIALAYAGTIIAFCAVIMLGITVQLSAFQRRNAG